MNLGRQIRRFRLQNSVRQEELADFLGVSAQAVSKWETEASLPDITLLPRIAMFFGITIDELFVMSDEDQLQRIQRAANNACRLDDVTFRAYSEFLARRREQEPQNSRVRTVAAQLYNHCAWWDHSIAATCAREALELSPDDHGAWSALIEAMGGKSGDFWLDNRFSLAQYLGSFLKNHPGNFRAMYALAENLLDDGRIGEVAEIIPGFRNIPGREYMYDIYSGDIALLRGETGAAREKWSNAPASSPDSWQAVCALAERLHKMGDFAEAIDMYEKSYAMQSAPRMSDPLRSIAQIFEQLGRYDDAIVQHRRIIANMADDFGITEGEAVESQLRDIERLKALKGL